MSYPVVYQKVPVRCQRQSPTDGEKNIKYRRNEQIKKIYPCVTEMVERCDDKTEENIRKIRTMGGKLLFIFPMSGVVNEPCDGMAISPEQVHQLLRDPAELNAA